MSWIFIVRQEYSRVFCRRLLSYVPRLSNKIDRLPRNLPIVWDRPHISFQIYHYNDV